MKKQCLALVHFFQRSVFLFFTFFIFSGVSYASSYDAELPAKLSTDPDMCAYTVCKEVIDADNFSDRKGSPPYVEAYKNVSGQKALVGYVFLTTDIVDIPAYSGKPVVTLVGMNTKGVMTGIKILKHSEPILLVGIPESKLIEFIRQYIGKFVGDKIEIGESKAGEGAVALDAISGATVTVIAENQAIMRSGYEVARQAGIVKPPERPQAKLLPGSGARDWATLLKEGSVQRLTVKPEDVGFENKGQPYIDLYFGYLNAPTIGQAILGENIYERLMSELGPHDHALFIAGGGEASFKGSGFVRGGIYDRIQVKQDMGSFTFRDTDYQNLYGIRAAGTPEYTESGIFILRGQGFSAAYPWSLVFLANKQDKETGAKTFVNFDKEYWLPAQYIEGGRPKYEKPDPTWMRVWKAKQLEIAAFILLLAITALVYAMRDSLVRRCTRKDKRWISLPKYTIWAISVGFVGYYAMAQPSITQIMTWFHSVIHHWQWELFLSDPFIFIFWWFIIITVFIWGRGLFCGWLCPFGSLTEIVHKVAGVAGLKRFQFQLPMRWHDRLKWLKYGVFFALIGVSFYSIGTAEKLAEIEPFKTTFLVGVLNRSWPYALFWFSLIGLSTLMERPFCKYLCPLGAGLAIPGTFRVLGLKRKAECATCTACARGCGPQAIDPKGRIDQRECLLCMDCQILYYDDHSCPPLAHERKAREKNGMPLTPISSEGYFIPVEKIGGRKSPIAGAPEA
jgi:NosR/NirI family nitrous oxide reductase transcriptional regulator